MFKFNKKTAAKTQINHNIQHIEYKPGGKQGGLLDVYFNQMTNIYISPTAIIMIVNFPVQRLLREGFRLMKLEIFQNLLIATPKLKVNRHYGSRIVIKDDDLYAGFGKRLAR